MTIKSMFTSEETIGSSGTERQQGICNVICELADELPRDIDINVIGVQGVGFYNDPNEQHTMVQIVRVIEGSEDKGMGVIGICILTTQGCMIEAAQEDIAQMFYTAVQIWGVRSGDQAVIKHDSRPPKEEEE